MHRHLLARLTPLRQDRLICRHLDAGGAAQGPCPRRWNQPVDRIQVAWSVPLRRRFGIGGSIALGLGRLSNFDTQSSWAALPVVAPRRHDPHGDTKQLARLEPAGHQISGDHRHGASRGARQMGLRAWNWW